MGIELYPQSTSLVLDGVAAHTQDQMESNDARIAVAKGT